MSKYFVTNTNCDNSERKTRVGSEIEELLYRYRYTLLNSETAFDDIVLAVKNLVILRNQNVRKGGKTYKVDAQNTVFGKAIYISKGAGMNTDGVIASLLATKVVHEID